MPLKKKSDLITPLMQHLDKESKRLNSAITSISMQECEKYGGSSIYVVYAKKGITKKELMRNFKDLLE